MPRTPKVVEDRREQILDAALHVFARKGFSRATNKDIAHEAGITPGLIYHYFESKEALLQAIIEARSPLALIRSLPPEVFSLPPEQFLRFMLPRVLVIVEGEHFISLIRMLLPEMLHNPNISPFGFNVLQQVTAMLERYFAQQMERGELRQTDTLLATQALIGSMMGFVLRRQIMRDPSVLCYTHAQIVDAVIEFSLKGLLPRENPPHRE